MNRWLTGLLVAACVGLLPARASADSETVTWTNVVKAGATPGGISKTATSSTWDAGGASTKGIGSGDGYMEFGVTNVPVMAGLSFGDTMSDDLTF